MSNNLNVKDGCYDDIMIIKQKEEYGNYVKNIIV
jgi:hypothetical protein